MKLPTRLSFLWGLHLARRKAYPLVHCTVSQSVLLEVVAEFNSVHKAIAHAGPLSPSRVPEWWHAWARNFSPPTVRMQRMSHVRPSDRPTDSRRRFNKGPVQLTQRMTYGHRGEGKIFTARMPRPAKELRSSGCIAMHSHVWSEQN